MKGTNYCFCIAVLLILSQISFGQKCYEIIEVKEIKYDITRMDGKAQTHPDLIRSEKAIDAEADNLYHIFNDEYALSQNYFGVEITERKSNRRFVKRDSDYFEEQLKHEDNPFLEEPKPTGRRKTIGTFNCTEYILENKYRSGLTFYIAEDLPFIYTYQRPYKFPGFIVSHQGYVGSDTIVEIIYDLKELECTEYFENLVRELEDLK